MCTLAIVGKKVGEGGGRVGVRIFVEAITKNYCFGHFTQIKVAIILGSLTLFLFIGEWLHCHPSYHHMWYYLVHVHHLLHPSAGVQGDHPCHWSGAGIPNTKGQG